MQSPKQLRKPSNWQDFETLCKKLWGEIWNCPEIKKNGRTGQEQHGVDIYGVPKGESQYYGIQCKGKDDYTNAVLKPQEIILEIQKAKLFLPHLKKLYFATTANKDAAIEAFARQQNIECQAAGLFEVHLYAWEDIVDLIDENRDTHNWYMMHQSYSLPQEVKVGFQNDSDEITLTALFKRKLVKYKTEPDPVRELPAGLKAVIEAQRRLKLFAPARVTSLQKINKSYIDFSICVKNTGKLSLKSYKLFLTFTGEYDDIGRKKNMDMMHNILALNKNVYFNKATNEATLVPYSPILVPGDAVYFDEISVKPPQKNTTLVVDWKLISEDYSSEGKLNIHINVTHYTEREVILIDDPDLEKTEEFIEDYMADE